MKKIYLSGVRVYKQRHGFIVRIGDDVFEMNHEADRPNGVNTHIGDFKEFTFPKKQLALGEIPEVILKAIAQRQEAV